MLKKIFFSEKKIKNVFFNKEKKIIICPKIKWFFQKKKEKYKAKAELYIKVSEGLWKLQEICKKEKDLKKEFLCGHAD